MGGITITKLVIIALLIVLLFGTNKLRSLGADLGAAIKGFKKAMGDDESGDKENKDADFKSVEDKQDEKKADSDNK